MLIGCIMLVAWWASWKPSRGPAPATLSAAPSEQLREALAPDAVPFARSIVRSIERRRYVTVTVHVALANRLAPGIPAKFADGNDPATNLHWGALFGVDTHLANAGGWRRAYADGGDGREIIRRMVFHHRAEPTPAWRARGVADRFDVYLLANAWLGSATEAAMAQPLRDALSGGPVVLRVEGSEMEFGAGSVMSGYLGPNRMIDHYWDAFAGLAARSGPGNTALTEGGSDQMGIFYICSMSAVHLHQPVVEHGLYSVLFARQPIVAEAYILEGILEALLAGDLDDGFHTAAAERYARYQKDVSLEAALGLFFR